MNIVVAEANERLFSDYGSVVKNPTGVPTAQGPAFRFWSDLASYAIEGETEIGLCTVASPNSWTITGVERHLRTPEILIPVDAPFVLPLLGEGRPSSDLKAFRVDVGEAVVIKPGIWHGACLPVGRSESTYFVIFRRRTPHEDVEKKTIAPVTITAG